MLSLVFCRPGQLNTRCFLPRLLFCILSLNAVAFHLHRKVMKDVRYPVAQTTSSNNLNLRRWLTGSWICFLQGPSELWDFHQPLQKIHVISCFLQQKIGCAHWRNWFPMSSCTNGVADIFAVSPWLHLLYWSDLRNLKWVGPISHHVVLITFVPTKASSVGRLWGNWCHCVRPPFPATSRIDHIYPRKDINLSEVLSLIINQILYLPTQSIWRGNLKEAAEGL